MRSEVDFEKLVDAFCLSLLEAAEVIADYAGLATEERREAKTGKAASNGRVGSKSSSTPLADRFREEQRREGSSQPWTVPPQRCGFSSGGTTVGIMPCYQAGCINAVDLSKKPDGYCIEHKAPVRRTSTDSAMQWRDLDRELAEAERELVVRKTALTEMEEHLADIRREIKAWDLVQKSKSDDSD